MNEKIAQIKIERRKSFKLSISRGRNCVVCWKSLINQKKKSKAPKSKFIIEWIQHFEIFHFLSSLSLSYKTREKELKAFTRTELNLLCLIY